MNKGGNTKRKLSSLNYSRGRRAFFNSLIKRIVDLRQSECMKILHEDDDIIVCVKEAGVATQTRQIGQKDMESMLRTYRMQKGESSYIGVVHRLDQPVSGVMVFAKNKEASAHLSRQIATKAADKCYYAVTDGVPEKKKATLEDYLLRDGKTNLSKVVSSKTEGAKRAELSYEVIAQKEDKAILRVQLATGRHHQIRVQLAQAGWPIVGDRKYNFKENMKPSGEQLALCSYRLAFKHPKTNKNVAFEIELPYQLI